MTFEEFIEKIEQIRHDRSMLFTSEMRLTDTYKRLHINSQNITNIDEINLIEKINNIDEFIGRPNELLRAVYNKSSSPENIISHIEHNLKDVKILIKKIF